MPMQIQVENIEGITVLRLKGRLVFGEEASHLQDVIQQCISAGKNNILIDLKDVPAIDSTGLGVLVVAHSATQKANGSIGLLHLSRRHVELLVLTKLVALFPMFDDEKAAIDSFFPDRASRRFDILEFVKGQENEPQKMGDEATKPEAE